MARETLTKDQIIRTAIELLDEEGLEGLNMRSLGKRLGAAATAVYWHVKNKDDLVLLVGDQVWDEVELPDLDAVDWRTAATSMALSLHAMLTRHPWLVQAFGSHLFYGPRKARHDDRILAVYEAAGFSGAAADRAAASVFTYVLGNALGASATASLNRKISREGRDPEEVLRETTAKAAEAASGLPHLQSRLNTTSAEYNEAPEATFTFGLESLIAGLETHLG
ncbi:TetR/AcrR family transcriptional regulator [Streptomyces sp. NPDC004244]|uniref:TetR/AcrR family transcriptional regulator n=1 Tax=Streptomyces sp. NPDC101206 TaxID=3366128 RepID=UPI00382D81C6